MGVPYCNNWKNCILTILKYKDGSEETFIVGKVRSDNGKMILIIKNI